MARVHDGKIGRGMYAASREKKITTDNHVYSMIYTAKVKVLHADITCPICRFISKITVRNEPEVVFRCSCGQRLRFEAPKG